MDQISPSSLNLEYNRYVIEIKFERQRAEKGLPLQKGKKRAKQSPANPHSLLWAISSNGRALDLHSRGSGINARIVQTFFLSTFFPNFL